MRNTDARSSLVVLAAALVLSVSAAADEISWTFQQIDPYPSMQSPHLALAMRTGATWPTVFYEGSQSIPGLDYQLVASSLTPVGWIPTGLGALQTPSSFMRACPGQDGRVGVTYTDGYSIRFAQSSPVGWQSSTVGSIYSYPYGAPDLGYLSENRPVVAYSDGELMVGVYDGLGWETELVSVYFPDGGGYPYESGERVSVAVNSQDSLGLAYIDSGYINFAFKSTLSGTWIGAHVSEFADPNTYLSLAFGPNDEPGLAMLRDGVLDYAAYDIDSGEWQIDNIATDVTSERVNLVFDDEGNPAVAFVSQETVIYSFNDGGGWTDVLLPAGSDPETGLYLDPIPYSDAALALDADGVPLIAYYGEEGLLLAYDPIIPEPSSALILLLGLGTVAGRRRQG